MSTSILNIGRTGAAAARASLELTAQNIANASNSDYTRRRMDQVELVGTARIDRQSRSTLNGVLIGDVRRFDSEFGQRQVRASTSDLARVATEISGLRDAELALEESGLYEKLIDFEASLTLLESDPTDPALRTGALETARQLTQTFQTAEFALSNARSFIESELTAGVETVNGTASELARINVELVNAREGTAGRAALLDARDAALRDLSEEVGITATFDEFGAAEVRVLADPPPPGETGVLLVSGSNFSQLSATTNNGNLSLAVGGASFTAVGGAMAGRSSALSDIAGRQVELDAIANSIIIGANAAQAAGSALDGSPGQPLFSGNGASDIALVLDDGAGLALAPAGAPAGSRDTSNLGNLIAAFGADNGPIAATDRMLLSLSSRISGLDSLRDGLAIIAESAEANLLAEVGVDLDTEATNLIRLQQAFEANSRVMQVATELFDTILGLG
ncbi:flagellar hook-associated protein FlgK [uncultured Erythrobacter sp.]|uniref:flagellar hook-associated protein FlgK n=1 Tax=uncultured Erythrobacter sp. TaxID=263913 RepID=UPI002607F640|nr:flagellar hook-associated protein FlgK [uncultured Erythrobacter sp.]